MNPPRASMRIEWAVDLSEHNEKLYRPVASVLRYFLENANALVEPLHVLKISPDVSTDFTAKWLPEYCNAAEEQIRRIVDRLQLKGTMPPRIVYQDSLSTTAAVDKLGQEAARSRAHLIVAQTHSRTGIHRLFLGSFAETLLTRSQIPVLLIGQEMKQFRGIRNILFPTDFGRRSLSRFHRVLDLAQAFRAKITLFHSVQHPIEPLWSDVYPMGAWGPFPEYVQRELECAIHRSKSWIAIARRYGVNADYRIDERGLSVWRQILSVAKSTNSGLIAMEGQSGPVSAALLGSTTRQVVRHSACPVLVLKGQGAHVIRLPKPTPAEPPQKRAA